MKIFVITVAIAIIACAFIYFLPENKEENALIKIWDQAESDTKTNSATLTDVKKFVEVAAPAVMTFGFDDFEKKKLENAHFFTKQGFISFYNAMKMAELDRMTLEDKVIAEADLLCIISIKDEKDEAGRNVSHAQFILHQKYISGDKMRQEWHNVLAVIMNKQDENTSYKSGFGIKQWLVTGTPDKDEAQKTCTR